MSRHVMPTFERHVTSAACWCRPTFEWVRGADGRDRRLWMHRARVAA